MRRLAKTLVCLIAVAIWSVPAAAESSNTAVGAIEDGDPRVEVELILDAAQAAPGNLVRAGVKFEIDPEWHVYWRNSGDSGLSTELTIDAGLTNVSDMTWPAPSLFVDKSGQVATFGYADEVVFTRSGRVPAKAEGSVAVVATIDYLACKVDCIPGRHQLEVELPIGVRESAAFPDDLANATPLTPDEAGLEAEVAFSRSDLRPGEELTATIGLRCVEESCASAIVKPAAAKRFTLIPDVTPGLEWRTTGIERIGEGTSLELQGRASRDAFESRCELAGVIWVGEKSRVPVYVSEEIACSDEPRAADESAASVEKKGSKPATPTDEAPQLPYILLLALLGGMILNLMPCVFPVLAVKVFSFVKLAHENRSSVFRHSGAYAAGIVTTMMGLAAVVIGLKAAGTEVGWGFQFQEPLFIAFLASALVLFALNLFGVFEVTLGSGGIDAVREAEYGLKRSFGEGILAVVLATPCSAPFLGTAVGFAFGADDATIVAVFFALGLGLALPFAILTAVPAWARLLPKPGPWMLTFKQLLGFALLGTCVWLVWVLGQNSGTGSIASLLTFLIAIGLAAWMWGKVQWLSGAKKWSTGVAALLVVAITGWFTLDFDTSEPPRVQAERPGDASQGGPSTWPAFNEATVRNDVETGEMVFVDFTADWCITCKVNERGVLSSHETLALFRDYGVKTYVADWTRKDDRIRRILARHGKAGVPMYLLYAPGKPESPQVLPELLTTKTLRDAVERAAGAN